MKIELLRFKGAYIDETPTLLQVNPMGFDKFLEEEAAHKCSLYVIRKSGIDTLLTVVNGNLDIEKAQPGRKPKIQENLPKLLNMGVRVDQAKKTDGRGLSGYFLKKERPVVLMGAYHSPKKVATQAFKLLQKALEAGEKNQFFLGASDKIFESLKCEAPVVSVSPLSLAELMLKNMSSRDISPQLKKNIKGISPEIQLLRIFVSIAASLEEPEKNPVLILGESGTGKGLVAREIHGNSLDRSSQPYVTLNCAAIPSELLESELFGIMSNVATGVTSRDGKWKEAGTGTLFLDEIGDMPLDLQAKILHALNDRKFLPIGGSVLRGDEVQCRAGIIAATNKPLLQMVEEGTFRKDLYYRLNKFVIQTYPLSAIPADVEVMLLKFWPNEKNHPLSKEVKRDLMEYPWPGNVREMKSVLNGLARYFPQKDITLEILHLYWEFMGIAVKCSGTTGSPLGEGGKLKVLRHLHQSQDIITSCQETMHSAFTSRKKVMSQAALQSSLQINLMRLNTLCIDASLFGDVEVYNEVIALLSTLSELAMNVLPTSGQEAGKKYWRQEIKEKIENVQFIIRRAKDGMLDNLFGSLGR